MFLLLHSKFTIILQDLILQRCVETKNPKKLDSPNSSVATETIQNSQKCTTFLDKCSHFSFKFYFSSVDTKFMYSQVLETNCKGVFVIKFKLEITVFLKFKLECRPKIGSFNLDLNFMHLWQHCSRDLLLVQSLSKNNQWALFHSVSMCNLESWLCN